MSQPGRSLSRERLIFIAYGFSGAATLADEVVWTRYLQLVLGSSVYAVSGMLTALMAGLALGGWIGARIGDRLQNAARTVALCELGVAVTAVLSVVGMRALPAVHLWTFQRFQLQPVAYFALDVVLCLPAVLAPTVLMGITFPLVAKLVASTEPERVAHAVGGAYAANLLGSIAGSALAGFALLPAAGIWGTLLAASSANVVAGVLVLVAAGQRLSARGVAAVLLLAAGVAFLLQPPRTPVGYHLAGRALEDANLGPRLGAMTAIFDRWSPHGRVQVLEDEAGMRVLVVDGRIEGASRSTERTTQHLLALLPGAIRGDQEDIFAIGLGTGRTLVLLLDLYRTASVECAEINPDVIEAVNLYFRSDLQRYLVRGDGRRLLAERPGPYDAIVSGPSFPVDATSGSLFTSEFFRLARERLRPAGLLVAWVPGYLLDDEERRALLATAARSFPELSVWRVKSNDDLVLIGSGKPFDDSGLLARLSALDEPLWSTAAPIEQVLDARGVREVLAGGPPPRLNRDDDPWLEFAMARNLVRGRSWLAL